MKKLKEIFLYLKNSKLNNKYIIALIIFGAIILFFDDSNLIKRYKVRRDTTKLEKEIDYYSDRIKQDSAAIEALSNSAENLERYAREQYNMKRPNEDIFIIKEK
jgi:cell division protein FtsB